MSNKGFTHLKTLRAFLEQKEPSMFSEDDITALRKGKTELLAKIPFLGSMHPVGWKLVKGGIIVSCFSRPSSEGKIGIPDFIDILSPEYGYAVLDSEDTNLTLGVFIRFRLKSDLVPNAPICHFPSKGGCNV